MVTPDPEKIKAVKNFPKRTTKKKRGLTGYFSELLKNYNFTDRFNKEVPT